MTNSFKSSPTKRSQSQGTDTKTMAGNETLLFTRDKITPDVVLHDAKSIPNATGYLWNKRMLLNVSCRGYANVHFMQPEPATYSSGPALEAKTFLQPEHQYYPGHPGRFFYLRDQQSGQLFSAPFAPVNREAHKFEFRLRETDISWRLRYLQWEINITVSLPVTDVLEMWQLTITNTAGKSRALSHFPCFNIGNQSWMNQSCDFDSELNCIIADKISPYQLTKDYEKQKHFLENTFFASEQAPDSWTTSLSGFLGFRSWQSPHALQLAQLPRQKAVYESPIAVMQFEQEYKTGETREFRYLFGPAKNKNQISDLCTRYLSKAGFETAKTDYQRQFDESKASLFISSPVPEFDHFVNHWLARQVLYHGDSNRLTTDPQTRNYLQDAMGMCYLQPQKLREALVNTLSQQSINGAIPDGVLLDDTATLKYINQVPHSDHAIWLPLCLQVYLNETADTVLLREEIPYADEDKQESLWQHIQRAMAFLESNLDERGLSLIHQGDWCDPMNMVGHKGKGVSAWLSMATSWSFQVWADICLQLEHTTEAEVWRQKAEQLNSRINEHFWDGNWFARGITDDGRVFGSHRDTEGKIYLNPQSWAMLCGAASDQQSNLLNHSVEQHLHSQFGITMLAPSYTTMQEDIGRLTQKYPGVAENGSVYCHAVAFYIYALWKNNEADKAFAILSELVTNEESCLQHGQLPVFIPNYYRGAPEQHPEHCGRSSRLFNTGTIAWVMRTIIEEMCGLKGTHEGLHIEPKLPDTWQHFKASRKFRGKDISISITRDQQLTAPKILVDQKYLDGHLLTLDSDKQSYNIQVSLPQTKSRKNELQSEG